MLRACAICALSSVLTTAALAQAQQQPSNEGTSRSSGDQQQVNRQSSAQHGTRLDADVLYTGWRARALVGEDVRSSTGREMGSLRDIIVDASGRASAIVVEGGGVAGIPDAVYRIPWQSLNIQRSGISVSSAGSNPDYGRAPGREGISTWPREYRLSEVIGDNARLRTGYLYGYVTDVVLAKNGRITAVLVAPDAAGDERETVAFPFHGRVGRWEPQSSYFGLPFVTPKQARQAGLKVDPARFADAGDQGSGDLGTSPPKHELRDDTAG